MQSRDLPVISELGMREASGFNWSGFRAEASLRKRFEEDGYLGPEDGWLVASVDDGPCLASVGWRAVNWSTPPYSRAWNIGLTVHPDHRRQGIGTRAQELLCDYLFETTGVMRVEATTNAANVAEQRALKGAGFSFEGVIRQAEFLLGRWHDLHMFSRLRSEWTPPAV
jgi:RimJ/RimL family protein N-acetyltransferase